MTIANEYLIVEIVLLTVTGLIHRASSIHFFDNRRQAAMFWLMALTLGAAWDSIAIFRGHWSYNPDVLVGVAIGNVPIEDFIFIFLVCYAAIVMHQLSLKALRER